MGLASRSLWSFGVGVGSVIALAACTTSNPNRLDDGGVGAGVGAIDLAQLVAPDDLAPPRSDGAADDDGGTTIDADLASAEADLALDGSVAPLDGSVLDERAPDLAPSFDAGADVASVGPAPDLGGLPGTTQTYVINAFTEPKNGVEYAIDLDGNGNVDNWLGFLNDGLDQLGLPTSGTGLNAAVQNDGDPLHLIAVHALAFDDAASALSIFQRALPTPSPKLDGTGVFVVNGAIPSATYSGPIVDTMFDSAAPATTTTPVTLPVRLPVLGVLADVDLVATHVTFEIDANGLSKGRLHGAIRRADLESKLLPVAAQVITSYNSSELEFFLDRGGGDEDCGATKKYCRNFDGSCGVPNNGVIEPCELRTSNLTKQYFLPDVDLFAADEVTYQPDPERKTPDSFSIGIAFTAVPASY